MSPIQPASVDAIQRAFMQQDISARNLAKIGLVDRAEVDLVRETVNQMNNKNAVSFNISSIKVQDQMVGELLDLQA